MGDDYVKICLNCGDWLLVQAKKCPFCGEKAKDFPLINRNDKERIEDIISNVPNPKNGRKGKWEQNLEIKSRIWNNSPQKNKERTAERKQKAEENGLACCPKCGSSSLSAHKKGFGIGKAVIGASIFGDIGLIAGNIGAKKLRVTCLNCGHQFLPGQK
jgi:hypothetical protein